MRFASRSIFAALSALTIVSCSDALLGTAPAGRTRASFAIVPRFSESATRAAAALNQAGLDFDAVRIVIIRPQSDTLKDTTIVFTPAHEDVTLELSVLAVPDEALIAAVQYTKSSTVLFSGSANVKSVAATAAATATPVEVTVTYTGPGATATKVTVSPGSGSYSASTTTQFSASATDANNAALPNTPISWSVSDVSVATISSTGLLSPKGQRGTVTVYAFAANGVADSVNVTLAPAATKLRVVQGAAQVGLPGAQLALPVIIEAVAADGLPAPAGGLTVAFTSNGGSISPANVALDANGRAQATVTLGSTAGTTYLYTATAGGFSITWAEIAQVGTPTHFVTSGGTTFTTTAGVAPAAAPTLRVADALENSVPGVILKLTLTKSGGPTTTANFPADSIGLLDVAKLVPTIAGTYTLLVETVNPVIPSVTYNFTVAPAAASKLVFTQQPPASVVANQAVTPAITVTIQDQYGNTVTAAAPSNINLSMDAATGTGVTINGTGSVTPVNGVATFTGISFTPAKSGVKIQAVGASLPAVLSTSFNITP